jgi:hypothetical protein
MQIHRQSWGRKAALGLVLACLGFSGPTAPTGRFLPLFVIERSVNSNVVHYDAKIGADGKLDPSQPVVAYWIMRAEDGRRQELNLLERTRAYGFSIQPQRQAQGMDAYKMTIVSERKREILVTHDGDAARAEMQIGGCHAYLQRIFVSTHKSLLVNFAESAELFGVDVASGKVCQERVAP